MPTLSPDERREAETDWDVDVDAESDTVDEEDDVGEGEARDAVEVATPSAEGSLIEILKQDMAVVKSLSFVKVYATFIKMDPTITSGCTYDIRTCIECLILASIIRGYILELDRRIRSSFNSRGRFRCCIALVSGFKFGDGLANLGREI